MKLFIPSICIYSALVELQDTPRLCAEGWMMDVYSSILYIGDGLFPVYMLDQPEISTANPQSSLSLESVVWRGNVEAVLRAWALSVMCVSSITAHYSGVCMHIYSGNISYITVMLKKKPRRMENIWHTDFVLLRRDRQSPHRKATRVERRKRDQCVLKNWYICI